jgi:hypothetical protein
MLEELTQKLIIFFPGEIRWNSMEIAGDMQED